MMQTDYLFLKFVLLNQNTISLRKRPVVAIGPVPLPHFIRNRHISFLPVRPLDPFLCGRIYSWWNLKSILLQGTVHHFFFLNSSFLTIFDFVFFFFFFFFYFFLTSSSISCTTSSSTYSLSTTSSVFFFILFPSFTIYFLTLYWPCCRPPPPLLPTTSCFSFVELWQGQTW